MAKSTPELVVRDSLRHYLRPLTAAERSRLEASLLADGCRDPLVVWPDGKEKVLVDGHHRHELCRQHGIPFATVEHGFVDEEEVLRWMVRHAEAKRNVTDTEKRYYLGARYLREKKPEGAPEGNNNRKQLPQSEGVETAERIAAEEGVGRATVERAADFALEIDEIATRLGEQLKWDILSERIRFTPKLNRAMSEAEPEKVREAIALAREAARYPDRPLSDAAVIRQLHPPPAPDAAEGGNGDAGIASPPDLQPEDIVAPVLDKVMGFADSATESQLAGVIVLLKSYVNNLEGRLQRRREGA